MLDTKQTSIDQYSEQTLELHKGQQLLANVYWGHPCLALVTIDDVELEEGDKCVFTYGNEWGIEVEILGTHRLKPIQAFNEIIQRDAKFWSNDLRQMMEYLDEYYGESVDPSSIITLIFYEEAASSLLSGLDFGDS